MTKDDKSPKRGGTRWWTWTVLGVVVVALGVGFAFRYELFGPSSVRAVRKIGRENKSGYLKPLRKIQDEVLADTMKAGFDAADEQRFDEATNRFSAAAELTADTSIQAALHSLIEACTEGGPDPW